MFVILDPRTWDPDYDDYRAGKLQSAVCGTWGMLRGSAAAYGRWSAANVVFGSSFDDVEAKVS